MHNSLYASLMDRQPDDEKTKCLRRVRKALTQPDVWRLLPLFKTEAFSFILARRFHSSYMLPVRNCGVSLGLQRPGIRLQRCLGGVIPQIRCGSI